MNSCHGSNVPDPHDPKLRESCCRSQRPEPPVAGNPGDSVGPVTGMAGACSCSSAVVDGRLARA